MRESSPRMVSTPQRSLGESLPWNRCSLPSLPSRRGVLLATHFLATVFTIFALSECSFMIENTANSPYNGSIDKIQVGLFSRSVYDNQTGKKLGCVSYTNHDAFDSMLRAGRAFGTFSAMFACASLLCTATVLLFLPSRWSKIMWSVGRYLLMTSTVTQMFTFFALGSDYLCQLGDCKLSEVGKCRC
jgi:hypothetical protein